VLNRSPSRIVASLLEARHYRAFTKAFQVLPAPLSFLYRYLTGRGSYPLVLPIQTPLGTVHPTLYHHHDLLTANEIFCREDYRTPVPPQTVVDLGSNIGLSALYFLTRSATTRCYLFEPVVENITKARINLAAFYDRYQLDASAVSNTTGSVAFGWEPSGRYGGIGVPTARTVNLPCRHVNEVLEPILLRHGQIDLLKIDTEGAEVTTVLSIHPAYLGKIRTILLETKNTVPELADRFSATRDGAILRLERRTVAWHSLRATAA
jgi:FkbM family methyltransferase